MRSSRSARDPVLQLGQLVAHLAGQQVDAGGGDLAELDVDAAGLFEHPAQPHAGRIDGPLGSLGGGEERPEALLAAQPHELPVAPEHGDPAAHGAHRTRRDDEPGPLARAPASPAGPAGRGSRPPPSSPGCRWRDSGRTARRRPSPSRSGRAPRACAVPQPMIAASSAVPHPRRLPSSRSDSSVVARATRDGDDDAQQHPRERRRPARRTAPSRRPRRTAPRTHRRGCRPVRRSTLGDELAPGLERRARRRAPTTSDASASSAKRSRT